MASEISGLACRGRALRPVTTSHQTPPNESPGFGSYPDPSGLTEHKYVTNTSKYSIRLRGIDPLSLSIAFPFSREAPVVTVHAMIKMK
jgi:hypothetical protein